MYRRKFLTNGTPMNMEKFMNETFLEWEIDNATSIELLNGHYSIISYTNNYLTVNSISGRALGNFKKYATEAAKVRYYIPLTSTLDAKIDICNDDKVNSLINVDFNSKEEALNFEIPSWFGAELVPELMVKTKIKSK